MPVKNVHSESSECSTYRLVDQNWHKMQSPGAYSVKLFWVAYVPSDFHALHVDSVSHNATCSDIV